MNNNYDLQNHSLAPGDHQDSHLLKIKDIADYLGLCPKTIRTLIKKGELAGYVSRIGGQFFITREKLDQFVEDMIVTK